MAIVRPDLRTKSQILGDNISGYINWGLDQRGYNRRRIIAEMRRRYPNASDQSINAAYNHVISARTAGRRQNRVEGNERLGRTDVPSDSSVRTSYRYTVRLEWTERGTSETRYFNAIVDSNSPLNNEDLRNAALNQAESIRAFSQHTNPRYQFQFPEATQITFDVIMVERKG